MKGLERITLGQVARLVEEAAGDFNLVGKLTRAANGGFVLNLNAKPTEAPEPPPLDAVVITPTGGDDTGKIQEAWNSLASGKALMLSGMFQLNACLWLEGSDRTLCGDPAKQSGLRPMKDGGYSGHYGAMVCTTPKALRVTIRDLELDMRGYKVQPIFFDSGVDITLDRCHIHDIGFGSQGPPCAAVFSQATLNLRVTNCRVERTGGNPGADGVRGIWLPARSVHVEGNHVSDTGHTCISVEAVAATVARNRVERSTVQGTGLKACIRQYGRATPDDYPWPLSYPDWSGHGPGEPRAGEPNIVIAENTVDTTVGGGLMLQDIGNHIVVVERNTFRNCGKAGTSFGALYSSNNANNVAFRDNKLENCRSIAGVLNFFNSRFEDTELVNTPDYIALEQNCRNIVVAKSGKATIGGNVSEVWVDGVKVA